MRNEYYLNDLHSYGLDRELREIYLHGFYSHSEDEPGVDYRMATTFIKNLNHLSSKDESILVYMQTIGGNWHDGMAIFNSIESCPCFVSIIAYGSVSSMSSVILQSSDLRVLMPDVDFMVHFGSTSMDGNNLAVISAAEYEKRLNDRMLNIYAEKCMSGKFFKDQYKSLTKDKVKNYLAKMMKNKSDWYMSAEEAVYYGFADGILGSKSYKSIQEIKKI